MLFKKKPEQEQPIYKLLEYQNGMIQKTVAKFYSRSELDSFIDKNYKQVLSFGGILFHSMPFYKAIKIDHENDSKETIYYYLFTQRQLKDLDFTSCIATNKMLQTWNIDHYQINNTFFTSKKDAELLQTVLYSELEPFVVKGSDWPYYFKIGDKYVVSNTSNWYKYLLKNFDYFIDRSLELYTGADKEADNKQTKLYSIYYKALDIKDLKTD